MERARHSALGTLLVGGGCLAAGLLVGHAVASRSAAPVWSDAPPATAPAAASPASFADVVARSAPAVVTVRAHLPRSAAEPVAPVARAGNGTMVAEHESGGRHGSGFVVHARGLVLTSRHIVAGAEAVEVFVPGAATLRAALVGEDPATDLALLRLVDPPDDLRLTVLPLGNSETLRAGDWIVAVGNPFGFSQTVTAGVVSFVGRHLQHSDFAVTNDFLQFSAPVNPGSSGCPVLDLEGGVVGITTQAAAAAQGISFAVPSRTIKWALDAMERSHDGRVRRGYLGVEFTSRADKDEDGRQCSGAVIVRVVEGQPGHRAGLRRGDVVLRVDGETIDNATALHERIVRGEPGSRIAVQLLRDGRVQDPIEAVLGEVGGPKNLGIAN